MEKELSFYANLLIKLVLTVSLLGADSTSKNTLGKTAPYLTSLIACKKYNLSKTLLKT